MDNFKKIQRILITILIFNWLVALSKIIYGIFTKCASMTADGVHSFGDGASNIIGLLGVWAASKPRDEEHPYGHKKFETIATLGIAAILFLAALNIFKEAFFRVFNPVIPDVTIFSFILMVLTLVINIFIMKYEHKKGHQLHSDILVCDSLHTRSDVFASLVVIGTLVSIKLGFAWLDMIVASVIAVLIARTGLLILRQSSKVLCDATVLSEKQIADIVNKIPGVRSVHDIRTRGRKDDIHVDLHVIIDEAMQVRDAHELSHDIESILKDKISGITEVNSHLEPGK